MDPYKLIGQAVQNASAPDLNFLIAQRELLDRQIQDQVRQNQMAADQENAIDRIKLDDKLSRERQTQYLDSQFRQSRELAQERSRMEQEAAINQARAMLPGQAKVLQFHMAQMEMADQKIDRLLNQDSDLKQTIDRLTVEALRTELSPRDFNVIVKDGQLNEAAMPKLGSQQKRVSKILKKARENALFDAQQLASETSQPLLQQVLRTYGDEYLANSKAVGELMTKNPLLAENIDEIMVDYFKTAKQAYGGGEGNVAPVSDPVSQVDDQMGDDVPTQVEAGMDTRSGFEKFFSPVGAPNSTPPQLNFGKPRANTGALGTGTNTIPMPAPPMDFLRPHDSAVGVQMPSSVPAMPTTPLKGGMRPPPPGNTFDLKGLLGN